jgi:hypothetical protein
MIPPWIIKPSSSPSFRHLLSSFSNPHPKPIGIGFASHLMINIAKAIKSKPTVTIAPLKTKKVVRSIISHS